MRTVTGKKSYKTYRYVNIIIIITIIIIIVIIIAINVIIVVIIITIIISVQHLLHAKIYVRCFTCIIYKLLQYTMRYILLLLHLYS